MKYKRLQESRKKQGISIWDMARVLRMNPIKYRYIEQHIKRMKLKDYLRISELLGLENELVGLSKENKDEVTKEHQVEEGLR